MNPPIRDWSAQRVWIIGASSGIGAALATQLLQRGAHVAVSARRAEALQAVVADHVERARCPSTSPTRPPSLPCLRRAVPDWGGIDLVVFCAGAYAPMRAWQLDANDIDRDARHQPARADGGCGAADSAPAEAGQRRAGLRFQRRRLSAACPRRRPTARPRRR
jgi:NAD(P)-dependent dehydrogenase (short-subunit alcohol dehydrogenase family)